MAALQEPADSEATTPVDAFILFNEQEDIVEKIVNGLSSRGISTHFWRRDIPIGSQWREIENTQLRMAAAVVVFLGDLGWGPNHLPLTIEARRLEKNIIPVLIGTPPQRAFSEAGGLFEAIRYLDLREPNADALDTLAKTIESAKEKAGHERESRGGSSGQFAHIINTLVDSSDDQRFDVLQQIVSSISLDKRALATRLREEIQSRFGPEQETRFASAVRDPKKIGSIRSWMLSCLIWADAVSASSRELVLRHLAVSFEPDRNVRFWAIAGLYQSGVPYLQDAARVCLSDPEPEVRSLAQAVAWPKDSTLIDNFRIMLQSDDFETAWAVLRLLRVMPIRELVPDVCAQLYRSAGGTSLSYDALYALANRAVNNQAVSILQKSFGVKDIASLVVEVARDSDRNARRTFATLLGAFAPDEMAHALAEIERNDPLAGNIVRMLRRLISRRSGRAAPELFVAGYTSDTIDVAHDFLDIREDVQTLAAVMLAKEVKPPLAIGLFGDWGSGKSFFMQSMKAIAEKIAADAENTPNSKFCSSVVPVEFNAWHYADSNLWASLVAHILERLAIHVCPQGLTAEEQLARLLKDLESAKLAVAQAEDERRSADQDIESRQAELQRLQLQRQQKEVELRDLRLADLRTLFTDKPEVKKAFDQSLERMGIPSAVTNLSDLNQAMSEVNSLHGRVAALVLSIFQSKNWALVLLLVVAVIAVPSLAKWASGHFAQSFVLIGQVVAEIGVILTGIATFLKNASGYVSTGLKNVENAKKEIDKLLEEKRKTPSPTETALQEKIANLKVQEEQTASRMRAATEKVIDLEQRIALLQENRSLTRFVSERTRSDDYRKHLGLISTIRRDFEELNKRLTSPSQRQGNGRVERIILYIDDLDRCPADKVVDVLQAVHLLLAYPLFVVVVGVDPRWLAHSLTTTYTAFKSSEGLIERAGTVPLDSELWRATPQNYLDKIFQIPFSLRPMTAAGYSDLVKGLFSPTGPEPRPAPAPRPEVKPAPSPQPVELVSPPPPVPPEPNPPQSPPAGNSLTGILEPNFAIHEEALTVSPVEEAFAERLYRPLPTPRATKRFANIYRILKAPISLDDLPLFEGTEQAPGTFQVPMLLLAILVGMPAVAGDLFPKLYRRSLNGSDPLDNLDSVIPQDFQAQKDALLELMNEIRSEDAFPRAAATFAYWLPRVSRFSFEIGRAINPTLAVRAHS
jgi:polyhydroxyalkanoate synthesis regulator phasin